MTSLRLEPAATRSRVKPSTTEQLRSLKVSYFGQYLLLKDVMSFLKKRMQELFAYVLEVILTLAKMQNNSTLMRKKVRYLRLEHFES